METNSRLLQNTFFGILTVNIISMISGIMCVMIDAIVTGQFLGTEAVTASGYLHPVILICQLFGALFGPGASIICTRYIGTPVRGTLPRLLRSDRAGPGSPIYPHDSRAVPVDFHQFSAQRSIPGNAVPPPELSDRYTQGGRIPGSLRNGSQQLLRTIRL